MTAKQALTNFKKGLKYWHQETYWPRDFHNRFYTELKHINAKGQFTEKWWNSILHYLDYWNATRPIEAYRLIKKAAKEISKQELKLQWQKIIKIFPNETIINVETNKKLLESFIKNVRKLKPYKRGSKYISNVFISKICHFASPERFPVVDNRALKKCASRDYLQYCEMVKNTWDGIPNKDKLKNLFYKEVKNATGDKIKNFPFPCKITEICLIGIGRRK